MKRILVSPSLSCMPIFFTSFPFTNLHGKWDNRSPTILPSTTLPKQWARYVKRTYVYAFCKHCGWLIVVEWKKIYVWHLNSWKASRVEENWRNQFLTTENGWFRLNIIYDGSTPFVWSTRNAQTWIFFLVLPWCVV